MSPPITWCVPLTIQDIHFPGGFLLQNAGFLNCQFSPWATRRTLTLTMSNDSNCDIFPHGISHGLWIKEATSSNDSCVALQQKPGAFSAVTHGMWYGSVSHTDCWDTAARGAGGCLLLLLLPPQKWGISCLQRGANARQMRLTFLCVQYGKCCVLSWRNLFPLSD